MPAKPANSKQLAAENEDLRARLEKAEETLREILSGEADALFVSGVAGAQLFTLKGADHSYRILIENMSEGALTLTPEGLVLYANRRFAGMLRIPLEKVIGSEIHAWFAPESRQVLQTLLRKDTVDNSHVELALAGADGTQVPVYLSVSRLHQDGIPDSLCMVATDLTEQKRNEAMLAAEKLARAILEQAADAIVICDENGRIIRASKEAQTFYGQVLVGKLFDQAFPLRQPDGTAFLPVGAVDMKNLQSIEARLTHNGQGFYFLVSVGHLKGALNELLGSVVTLTDITARKHGEEALRASEAEFRTLAEAMPQIVWITRADGWNIYFNQHWMDYTGLTLEESLGHGWNKPFHPDDQQRAWDAWQHATKEHGVYSIESRLRRADGIYRWWLVRGVPLTDANGNILKWFGTCTDIHDIKLAELEISRANGMLRESQRRFSDLLENIELVSMMLDREARITYCNDYLLRLTGWQREEVIGKNWFEFFIPPEIQDLKDEFFAALIANQPEARHHENEILTRSGERRLVRWNNSVLRSANGDVIGTASIGEDITERKQAEKNLKLFRALLDNSSDAIEVIEPVTLRFLDVNNTACLQLGYSREELLSMSVPDIDPIITPELNKTIGKQIQESGAIRIESIHRRKDGSTYPVEISSKLIELDRPYALNIVRDITERKAAAAKILYLNRVYAVLSGINTLIVRVNNRDELFRESCRIAVEVGGFRMAMVCTVDRHTNRISPVATAGKDEELLTGIKDLMASSDASKTMVALVLREKQTIVSNDSSNDPRVLLGKHYAESGVRSIVILPLIVSGEAVGALALYAGEIEFFHDEELLLLTELAGDIAFAIDHLDKQKRLDYLAYYDVLTGLANRSLFLERVAQYMRSAVSDGHKLALCLIDLERFKNINDSLGRTTGDALLKQVAEWLTHNTGDVNLLSRIDADHFAVVLPEIRQEGELMRLVEKMSQAFQEHPFRFNDSVFRISAKTGIALFPDDGDNADTLFRNAEAALKKAKARGDRYLFYTQKMTEAVAGKLTLENQLRQAIDNEEFVLHYQPKVNLESGKVTSAEALIRWNDPRTGLVPPGKFIPILEETGLIQEVGRWAMRKAIADNLRWRSAGLPAVRIAVNVSALQLHRHDFIAEVGQAIAYDPHAAAGLELEITESLIMEDVRHSIDSLQAIRAMGITIAIDDFGTGFSSLGYLAKLPIDTLKIDRSFVIEMTVGSEGLALVSTIISLAHALKFKVVAEGVETEEQSRLLRLLGCDEMQGFLFSKAVPCEEFETRFLAPLTLKT